MFSLMDPFTSRIFSKLRRKTFFSSQQFHFIKSKNPCQLFDIDDLHHVGCAFACRIAGGNDDLVACL